MIDRVDLMVDGVLDPVRRGGAVSFRPPKWAEKGRAGAVEVPAGCRSSRASAPAGGNSLPARRRGLGGDPRDVIDRRDAERIAAGETGQDVYELWMAEEHPFVAEQRRWEQAFAVVDGTSPDGVVLHQAG